MVEDWHKANIKPLLTEGQKMQRLRYAAQEVARGQIGDMKDMVHVDESWFFIMWDGMWQRYFPSEDREPAHRR